MLNYLWTRKPLPATEKLQDFSEQTRINKHLSSILLQRGISTFDDAKAFFNPDINDLHDPFLMKDMDKAVERLSEAIENDERILIYGDYDVDGTTSVATFYGFIREFYNNADYYIPDRYKEGYGVSTAGIEYAKEHGYKLMISIDCGIKAIENIALAKEYGVDFIVCDHHRPGDELPPAIAILDPKQSDCNYPYDELCGCGVGFKLLQGWCQQNGIPEERLFKFLDLVAIGTASDLVPLLGENRILTSEGIRKLNTDPLPGVRALKEVAGYEHKNMNVTNVVFGIGPRINAAGRLKHAKYAAELLLEQDTKSAVDKAFELNEHNTKRRNLDKEITAQALDMIQSNEEWVKAKSTVLFQDSWSKGVIGIVASRCIENYFRPTIILTESKGKATGSARSVLGFDVYDAISECSDLLEQFGGHMYAAGLTMDLDKVDAFRTRFEEVVSAKITEEMLTPRMVIDLDIELDAFNDKFYQVMQRIGPFGPENLEPLFASVGVVDTGKSRIVGDNHLKLEVQQNGKIMQGIAFGMGGFLNDIRKGAPFDICYHLDENTFNGRTNLQLMVKDIKMG
jgi:single-stranded-DNA-specific exonuclease